jgi:hypothetical protein
MPETHPEGSSMRIRTTLCLLVCCCAAITGCTAAAPKGPNTAVTKPSIGKPPAPTSEGAALDSEALTPYFDLGAAANDGLAPGDTYAALETACMDDAGYSQYASSAPFFVRANRGLGFPQPYGPWGYIGVSEAEQYAFNSPAANGPDEGSLPGSTASLPEAANVAEGKCSNIVQAFNDAQFVTSTALIETLDNDVGNDVVNDPDLKRAQTAWTACMARNGYGSAQVNSIWQQYLPTILPSPGSSGTSPGSSSGPSKAQIAVAVTDADCTLSTDLGGIYFAIQGSYERQFATANQQALNASVREFKANFGKELDKLPALLRTTSAKSSIPGGRPGKLGGRPGKLGGRPGKPGTSHPGG